MNAPFTSTLISTSFDQFAERLNAQNALTEEAIVILRLAFFAGAFAVFSELVPIEKITVISEELTVFASNPQSERTN